MGHFKEDSEKNSEKCIKLAREGNRQCKKKNYRSGVKYFLAAIEAGTEDLNTLSVIYCQLGNAYFYLHDYPKAFHYHECDLTLATIIGDSTGEVTAVHNLGKIIKAMGHFDKAILWFEFHLDFYLEIHDERGQEVALYNLANIYHTIGKQSKNIKRRRRDLKRALELYTQTLKLNTESGDETTRGQILGQIGNVYFVLRDFQDAVYYQIKSLELARLCDNRTVLRRRNTDLANSYIFLNEFEKAAEHYRESLVLAEEEGSKKTVAKICYLLANTYSLMHDYPAAIETHLRYLKIVQQLEDKVGEGRAYWCLSNAYLAIANHKKALHYANLHLQISTDLGDVDGIQVAQTNIQTLDIDRSLIDKDDSQTSNKYKLLHLNIRDDSYEQLDCMEFIQLGDQRYDVCTKQKQETKECLNMFDLIEKLQSQRIDEQRVTMSYLPGFK